MGELQEFQFFTHKVNLRITLLPNQGFSVLYDLINKLKVTQNFEVVVTTNESEKIPVSVQKGTMIWSDTAHIHCIGLSDTEKYLFHQYWKLRYCQPGEQTKLGSELIQNGIFWI